MMFDCVGLASVVVRENNALYTSRIVEQRERSRQDEDDNTISSVKRIFYIYERRVVLSRIPIEVAAGWVLLSF